MKLFLKKMGDAKPSRSQKMGLLGATSYIIGNIVGSGIFITPTTILKTTGSVSRKNFIRSVAELLSENEIVNTANGLTFCSDGTLTYHMDSGRRHFYVRIILLCRTGNEHPVIWRRLRIPVFHEMGIGIELDPTSEFWAKKLVGFSLMWVLLFMNFFSLKTFVSRFQIAASIAKIAATGLVIGTGFYLLIFKGKLYIHERSVRCKNYVIVPSLQETLRILTLLLRVRTGMLDLLYQHCSPVCLLMTGGIS
ncbi:hypothetical protein OESDEN_00893 [Oesophagostomum dentatum]|uniref:Uncharacterized protein n=1 Tax=Oesophagostomum dentatum TaxID=61180 RepID=A0A0B1TUN6_OESDE|nr:hypothetical protein OESDEN_00893 [Oesophagostomum dentatum]